MPAAGAVKNTSRLSPGPIWMESVDRALRARWYVTGVATRHIDLEPGEHDRVIEEAEVGETDQDPLAGRCLHERAQRIVKSLASGFGVAARRSLGIGASEPSGHCVWACSWPLASRTPLGSRVSG